MQHFKRLLLKHHLIYVSYIFYVMLWSYEAIIKHVSSSNCYTALYHFTLCKTWKSTSFLVFQNVTNYFSVFQVVIFLRDFLTKILYAFLFFPNLATCSAHCSFFHFTALKGAFYVTYWTASSFLDHNIFLIITCMFWNSCNWCHSVVNSVCCTSIQNNWQKYWFVYTDLQNFGM
jgi:hypothetical protein